MRCILHSSGVEIIGKLLVLLACVQLIWIAGDVTIISVKLTPRSDGYVRRCDGILVRGVIYC